jgi:hypothetical protein
MRRVATVMGLVAVTLAVASAAHLSGHVHGRGAPYDASHAGIAEAVIGVVLIFGADAVRRGAPWSRAVGLAATGFATAGFLLGLQFTARGGHLPDVAYHLTILPVLVALVVVLARLDRPRR